MKPHKFDIVAMNLWGPPEDLEIYRSLFEQYLKKETDIEHKVEMMTKLLKRIVADHPELVSNKELLTLCREIDKERRTLLFYQEVEEMTLNADTPEKLPAPFDSEEAKKYWERLQEAGFVEVNYQLAKKVSRRQAMYIADLFSETIGVKAKWKPFEQLWNMNNLAQEKHQMQESGILPRRHKEIEQCFAD